MVDRTEIHRLLAEGIRPAQIASALGISRQRVYQIVGPVGSVRKPVVCRRCSITFQPKTRGIRICDVCRSKRRVTLYCAYCGAPRVYLVSDVQFELKRNPDKRTFCSSRCSALYYWRDRNLPGGGNGNSISGRTSSA